MASLDHNKEYYDLVLASLLHDIGKFYLRAGFKLNEANNADSFALTNYSRETRTEAGLRYHYYHAAMTDKFFREFLNSQDLAGHLAALHHCPENATHNRQTYLARMIQLADWLSAGERIKLESDEATNPKGEPLISIFSMLSLDGGVAAKESYLRISYMDPELNNLFPEADKSKLNIDYCGLWSQFVEEVRKLKSGNQKEYLTQIYYLLQKYTISIPSAAYREVADISLFHHLKSVAALASCIYLLDQSNIMTEDKLKQIINSFHSWSKDNGKGSMPAELGEKDFLLVGGDVSGIQEFLYQVTSEKALKGLRGRSFYLQIISEILAKKILDEFELSECNLLYCGGGNFYVLLPAVNDAIKKLEEIQTRFDSVLLKAHKGKLSVILSYVEVSYADFLENFAGRWSYLGQKLAINKKRKFSSLLKPGIEQIKFQEIFGPYEEGGEKIGCSICGEELDNTPSPDSQCSLCESFARLASQLKDGRAMSVTKLASANIDNSFQTWSQVINGLGYSVKFFDQTDLQDSGNNFHNAFLVNNTDFAGSFLGYVFIPSKTYSPDGEVLTLERISEAAKGIKKWGVLRADVDNLGKVFRDGLKNNRSISRVSMLSFMISAYFNGRLAHIDALKGNGREEKGDQISSYIYTAYSGGDDLLMIGPWSELLELASLIREDFSRFTGKKLTISAGIYYAPTKKFPIYQAAREAGEAVNMSKKEGKNKITIFGQPVRWEEYKKVKEITDLLIDLITDDKSKRAPRSLLNILRSIYQEKELKLKKKINMERIWRFYYAIRTIWSQLKNEDIQKEKLEKLVSLVMTDYEVYSNLNIATRLADYLTRKET